MYNSRIVFTEAVARRRSLKKVLEISQNSQNSQEITCARDFFNKVTGLVK